MSPPVTAARPMKLADLDVLGRRSGARRRAGGRRPSIVQHVRADARRCARRARRGSGRGPGRAARRRRSRSSSRRARATAAMTAFSVRHHRRLVEEDLRRRAARRCAARSARRPSISAPSRSNAWRCGSSRRRPITSPPGGGTLARPRRASSGPASRNEARMRSASSLVGLVRRDLRRVDAHLVRAGPLGLGAEAVEQPEHRLDVADPRHVRERHRLVGEQARGEDRQRAVLVPGGADAAAERVAALDHERLRGRLAADDGRVDNGGGAMRTLSRLWNRPANRPGRRSRATRRARRCCATRSPSRRRPRSTRASSARTRSCGA